MPSKKQRLRAIAEQIAACRTCRKKKIGLPVPGEGNPGADIVFIGEAPGKEEAATGRPFVGRAGKILRRLIREIDLTEKEVFITSPVKYLPIHKTPTNTEIAHGRTHTLEQIRVIQPKIIVLLGRVAVRAMLERNIIMTKEHGEMITKDGQCYFISYHPAAMLYSQTAVKPLRDDFKKLQRLLVR